MSSPISSLLWPIEELELVDIGEKETLGLINIEEKESVVAKTLRVMKILKENGVNLKNIQMIEKGKFTLLSEIQQEGINIEKIIENNDLKRDFQYGMRLMELKETYKGRTKCKITEEERRMAEELGLINSKDIKDKLKSTVSKHVSTNQETRAELARQEKELTGNRENEGEIKDD